MPGREVILERIREALGRRVYEPEEERVDVDGAAPMPAPMPSPIRSPATRQEETRASPVDRLQERLEDYGAGVWRCNSGALPAFLASRVKAREIQSLAVPSDLAEAWWEELAEGGCTILRDLSPDPLTARGLARAGGVLTGCALAIAETGTLLLDGGAGQGRRALSLLPDIHLCVVAQSSIVETVPDAFRALRPRVQKRPGPLTLISGPSATSDIELVRVEGVHGPRTLDVILVEDL